MSVFENINLDNLNKYVSDLKASYENANQLGQHDVYMQCMEKCANVIRFMDTLNPFQINRIKDEIRDSYYISAELYVRTVGLNMQRKELSDQEKGVLYTAIVHLQKCLQVDPLCNRVRELFKVVFIYLSVFNFIPKENIKLLRSVLPVEPTCYQLHYNLGFMYHRDNQLDDSLSHYKLALGILELHIEKEKLKHPPNESLLRQLEEFQIKCYNGIGGIYFAVQDRELAIYYFSRALELRPDDPDINNQLGVVYTELRLTDKAISYYKHGIENAKKAHISTEQDMLLASMYMNMGLAYCYEINYTEAIECYNKALKYKPRLSLAYQNKLLDLNYISHMIENPMYIAKLHKNLNKIYEYVENDYKKSLPNYVIKQQIIDCVKANQDPSSLVDELKERGVKLNIGFVSGDFISHPVSYFLNSILKFINTDVFNVHCFSLKIVQLHNVFPHCKWHLVKNTSPEELKKKIEDENIDILFDMSSQTGDNRLDTFVLKPAPIQISYCGYPNTSGLSNMDYHIVDCITDSDGKTPSANGKVLPSTQKYYTEKLLFTKRCFLNYTPAIGIENLPELVDTQPCVKNNYLTIGTFNRYNKINDNVIRVYERILEECPNVKFIIKTKEFLTPKLRQQFIDTWKNKELLDRIEIMEYSDLYTDHLLDYNKMDIALDTFPYSGTTTSCEALMMGCPVLCLYDLKRQYHSQNVSSSLMYYSELSEYITFSEDEFVNKVKYLSNNMVLLMNLKKDVRDKFVKNICNYPEFVKEFETMLITTYGNHTKW